MLKYDLAVAGGGFAGVAAAISAARAGQSVLLVKKSNCLGGAAVNCLVNPFMPNLGEAAGTAAGVAAKDGAMLNRVDVKKVRLKDQGAAL